MSTRRLANAYRAGWNRSSNPNRADLETEEDRYLRRGRSEAQQRAWLDGWIDYASDLAYGTALSDVTL